MDLCGDDAVFMRRRVVALCNTIQLEQDYGPDLDRGTLERSNPYRSCVNSCYAVETPDCSASLA